MMINSKKSILFLVMLLTLFSCKTVFFTETDSRLPEEVYHAVIPEGVLGGMPGFYYWKNKVKVPSDYEIPAYDPLDKANLLKVANEIISHLNKDPYPGWSQVKAKEQHEDEKKGVFRNRMGLFFDVYEEVRGDQLRVNLSRVLPYGPASKAGLKVDDLVIEYDSVDTQLKTNLSRFKEVIHRFDRGRSVRVVVERETGQRAFHLTSADFKVAAVGNVNPDPTLRGYTDRLTNTIYTFSASSPEMKGQKVGYLRYRRFIDNSSEELKELFGLWRDKKVSNVVIDLQGNGGGSVLVARDLASMMITNRGKMGAKEKEVYFTKLIYNDRYGDMNRKIFFNPIDEKVTLKYRDEKPEEKEVSFQHHFSTIYFLVNGGTASASEMLILGLKPFTTVCFLNPNARTLGKGVGQYEYWDTTGSFLISLINFRYENSKGKKVALPGEVREKGVKEDLRDDLKCSSNTMPEKRRLIYNVISTIFLTSSPPSSSSGFLVLGAGGSSRFKPVDIDQNPSDQIMGY